jgi:hypothetical protein
MVCVPIPWAGRTWALPFLTVLAPSARWSEANGKPHKTLTTWARQAILQTKRWLPNRRLICLADNGFSALDLLAAVRRHACMVTRLRLDANLFQPAPKRRPGQRGRTPVKGRPLPKLAAVLTNKKTVWTSVVVSQWYNAQQRTLLVATGTALWYHAGIAPVPIRWLLVRDPSGEHEPCAFLSTDLGCQAGRNSRLVRLALASGNHVPGGPRPSRRGDAAPMVGFGDSALYPGAARVILADHGMGRWSGTRRRRRAAGKCRCMVHQARAYLQRRHRRCPPRAPDGSEFVDVPETGRDHHNSSQLSKSSPTDSMSRRLNCGKSS